MGPPRAASHYQGEPGRTYFSYQEPIMAFSARFNQRTFQPSIRPQDTVVDFGCGAGELLERLDAGRKIGVEVNEPARRAAEERGVETVESAADLDDEIADVVISYHALEHTLAPYDELVQLWRSLKPGGKLVLWLPIDDWRVERELMDEPDHHLYTWSPRLLRNLLVEAGFRVTQCRVVTYAWPPRYYEELYRLLPRRAFDLLGWVLAVALRRRQLMALAERPIVDA